MWSLVVFHPTPVREFHYYNITTTGANKNDGHEVSPLTRLGDHFIRWPVKRQEKLRHIPWWPGIFWASSQHQPESRPPAQCHRPVGGSPEGRSHQPWPCLTRWASLSGSPRSCEAGWILGQGHSRKTCDLLSVSPGVQPHFSRYVIRSVISNFTKAISKLIDQSQGQEAKMSNYRSYGTRRTFIYLRLQYFYILNLFASWFLENVLVSELSST